jgi:transposase-like protein
VLRALRGESLDTVSRAIGVTAGTLAGWRDQFLLAGEASLKSRPADERDDEIQRLRAKIGEITMANELLLERCHRMEDEKPFLWPRRRR